MLLGLGHLAWQSPAPQHDPDLQHHPHLDQAQDLLPPLHHPQVSQLTCTELPKACEYRFWDLQLT